VEIVTVPGAGHIIVHDKPQEFERLVVDFLKRHGV
ncbi:MAG: alpha/beta hydrolase, partial [Chloroflexi bacterium]|nr:alpha/beta hydrolase [Chloroflexota bacterium]